MFNRPFQVASLRAAVDLDVADKVLPSWVGSMTGLNQVAHMMHLCSSTKHCHFEELQGIVEPEWGQEALAPFTRPENGRSTGTCQMQTMNVTYMLQAVPVSGTSQRNTMHVVLCNLPLCAQKCVYIVSRAMGPAYQHLVLVRAVAS